MSYRLIDSLRRTLACLTFVGGLLIILFWTLYFTDAITLSEENKSLIDRFESAFPFADALLGAMLLTAGLGLLRKKRFGTYALVVSSSMTVYLGILDVTFYLEQGLYFPLTISSLFQLSINLFCIGGGTLSSWFGWHLWRFA